MPEVIADRIFQDGKFVKRDGADPVDPTGISVQDENITARFGLPATKQIGVFGSGAFEMAVPELQPNTPFTIEVLCNPTAVTRRGNILEGSRVPVALFVESGHFVASVRTTKRWVSARADVATDAWQLLTVVYNGDELFLFIDRKIAGRQTIDHDLQPVGTSGFVVGAWTDKVKRKFSGSIAAIKIWSGVADSRTQDSSTYAASIKSVETSGELAIEGAHVDLGGDSGELGKATSREHVSSRVRGNVEVVERSKKFQKGNIFWSQRTGPVAVVGPVATKYNSLGGTRILGLPVVAAQPTKKARVSVSKFENGYLYHTPAGVFSVRGLLLGRYLDLGGETGELGLPTGEQKSNRGGLSQTFEKATLYSRSTRSTAFEVHGAIRTKYRTLGGPSGFLGFPLSNETVVQKRSGSSNRAIGRLSRFEKGTIYYTRGVGAFEIHGAIRKLYEQLGGPNSNLGFPTSDETSVPGSGVRYSNFQHGVIVWKRGAGAKAITKLRLHVGEVTSGTIDDGAGWFKKDKTAELVTYTTVVANGKTIENKKRRPGGHAGSSYNINKSYDIGSLTGKTTIKMKVKVDDWDRASSNDYLGTHERTFDARTFWGLLEGSPKGVFVNRPATHKGGDLPRLNHLQFDYSVSDVVKMDPAKQYREQYFWRFDNFSTPALSRSQYANTFRDVEHAPNTWDKIMSPFDTLYYEAAYKGIASSGNCFGHSLESVLSRAGMSVFQQPLDRHVGTRGDVATADASNILPAVKDVINIKHGYQLGASAIRWTIARLATGDAVKPTRVVSDVQRYLSRSDWPVLCMVNWSDGKGHCVVPYKVVRGTGNNPDRIYVADPNKVWREQTGEPSYVEVYKNNTYKYFGGTGKSYERSGTTASGILPSTLLLAYPLHRLCSTPRTPFWEALIAVAALLSGAMLILGDSEAEQVEVNQTNLISRRDGKNYLRPTAGAARIPVFDTGGTIPELYATTLERPAMETSLRGTKTGTVKQLLFTNSAAVTYVASTRKGISDTVRLAMTERGRPQCTVTSSREKEAAINVADFDARSGLARSVSVGMPLEKNRSAKVGFEHGSALAIHGVKAGQPINVQVTNVDGSRGRPVEVRPETSDEALLIRPESFDPARPEIIIDRFSGLGGQRLGTFIDRG